VDEAAAAVVEESGEEIVEIRMEFVGRCHEIDCEGQKAVAERNIGERGMAVLELGRGRRIGNAEAASTSRNDR
jgi:hypothetical protein